MTQTSLAPSAGHGSHSVEISCDVAAVQPQWAALEEWGTPFQTRAWLLPWYRIVAPHYGATPLFVTVRDADARRPEMFIPLWLRRRRGLRTIEFPDIDACDYNAPLVAPDLALTASELADLWDEIRRALPAADLVRFAKVPTTICGRDNPLARLAWIEEMKLHAWLLELPATRAAYDQDVLDPKARKEHKRKRRRLNERVGDFALFDAATPGDGEEIFAALRTERKARFGGGNALEDPCFRAFYHAVIFDHWSPFVELSALKANGRILASMFGLRRRGAYFLLMHSFEPTLEAVSPGIVAIDEMISRRTDAGDRYFDFTVGDEGYKRQFGVRETPLVGGAYPLSPLGQLYVLALPHARRGRDGLLQLVGAARRRLSRPRRARRRPCP